MCVNGRGAERRRARGRDAGAWCALAAEGSAACRAAAGQMLGALMQDGGVAAALHASVAAQESLDQARMRLCAVRLKV